MIDKKLIQAGWTIQDRARFDPTASLGVAVRETLTSTGSMDYTLFVDGVPVGVLEAKRDEMGGSITGVERQSERYANGDLKSKAINLKRDKKSQPLRFAYEATGTVTRFTDYHDLNYSSREIFSFHQPETLKMLTEKPDTVRNYLKCLPALNTAGFRKCQIAALRKLEASFAANHPRALIQMATGAGKTFTAITAAYRLLEYGHMKRILFLVDTKNLGIQADQEFRAYRPNDDPRLFTEKFVVQRLTKSHISKNIHVCISTIQRMYAILKGEELDESEEEESMFERPDADSKKQPVVVYNSQYPPEFFDCIIIDECHRSIYNVWSQVLKYFDAFQIGLTATPDTRTLAYFRENIVSEYTHDEAIRDNVNVGADIFRIETDITKNGAYIMKQEIEYRDRLTHARRWAQMDEDITYTPSQLDRDVVNPSQIRTVIDAFRDNLFTQLFPQRERVPKTLIFAKTDTHADDIVKIVREEFGLGNEFCQKITCKTDRPETVLSNFRTGYNPRIAVTVDMLATGIDVKPIECLIFMRDVRSRNYFEQMKGRGTRTLDKEDLILVTPDATENKDHFVIVDAVGVTQSQKTDTRPLECRPKVSTKELMRDVAQGARDKETLVSLANRLIRLNSRMTPYEREQFSAAAGESAADLARRLLDAFDPDIIAAKAGVILTVDAEPVEQGQPVKITEREPTEEERRRMETAQKELAETAVLPFQNPELSELIEKAHRSHEQILDHVNLDSVLFAGYNQDREANAAHVIQTFQDFIEKNRDEILALRIIYDQRYRDRPMAIEQLKKLYETLKESGVTIARLWDCYAVTKPEKVKRGTLSQLSDLISLIRFAIGATDTLAPFADRVDANFQQWTFRRNAGAVHFTEEQMEWLRLIKDHIAASLSVTPDDLELSPFDSKGGLGRFYDVFGEQYETILHEMNVELVA